MTRHPLLEEIDAEGDVIVLRLHPVILCTRAAHAVCTELSRLVSKGGHNKLHLDFGGVEYLAAAGLGQLLALHAALQMVGGGLRLCSAEGSLDLDRLSHVVGPSSPGLAQPA
jgi:anti-anti-sigma regulatory factor